MIQTVHYQSSLASILRRRSFVKERLDLILEGVFVHRWKEERNLVFGLMLLLFSPSSNLNAQTKTDEEAVRKLPQAHCDA
jgi:hypothetical protein